MMARLNYGGQAVMEGVMMRGQQVSAISVRSPSGSIVVHREALPATLYRGRISKIPFLRGLIVLWDSLGLGMRALMWSADVALSEEEEVSFSGPLAWGTIAVALAFGVGLFFLLPLFIATSLDRLIASDLISNLLEGLVRLALFLGYLWVIGFMPDVRRVFAYHGAEHKTINAYEGGAQLEPERVAQYPRSHTRCGTSFLLIVMIIFVLLATLMGRPPLLIRLVSRLALIPIVSGIAYEFMRFTANHYETSGLVRALVAPGLALQRLTTREPEMDMLEVSIRSLNEVLESEGLLASDGPDADGVSDAEERVTTVAPVGE